MTQSIRILGPNLIRFFYKSLIMILTQDKTLPSSPFLLSKYMILKIVKGVKILL